jgi:hypothetical protein
VIEERKKMKAKIVSVSDRFGLHGIGSENDVTNIEFVKV